MDPAACTRCPLHTQGTPVATFRGSHYRPGGLVFMYDMPSPREFETGCLHHQTLQGALTGTDLDLERTAVLSWVKCRPPRGRLDDTPFAVVECESWRQPELEELTPGVLILMGRQVVQSYFGATVAVGVVRGKPLPPGKHGPYPVIATWHPWATKQDQRLRKEFVEDVVLATELSTHAC